MGNNREEIKIICKSYYSEIATVDLKIYFFMRVYFSQTDDIASKRDLNALTTIDF